MNGWVDGRGLQGEKVMLFFFLIFICLSRVLVAACGIQFPDQGLNPGSQNWEHSLNYWTTREAPITYFF